ncbi:MAG: TPM domain-containing protein [Bdellovibrionales bacterium]|nr:TPM domain-containing protein [Bdellovibrionales bacterium]
MLLLKGLLKHLFCFSVVLAVLYSPVNIIAGESPQAFIVPKIQNYVNDYAQIVDAQDERALNTLLNALKKKTGMEFIVLTVENLSGLPIEMASIQVVDQWKLGTKKEDKGLLLMISKTDRSLRLEVGQGLEGVLPDVYTSRIIQDTILPYFKRGQFSKGIVNGVLKTLSYAEPEFLKSTGSYSEVRSVKEEKKQSLILLIFKILGILLIIYIRLRFWPFFGGFGGGSLGGGSFGGGGFGGGGSFGGGGGFSGGGSSGRW